MARTEGPKAHHLLETISHTILNRSDQYPLSRGRCFDVGIVGGCGHYCPVLVEGECPSPQELLEDEGQLVEAHGKEDANYILNLYQAPAGAEGPEDDFDDTSWIDDQVLIETRGLDADSGDI